MKKVREISILSVDSVKSTEVSKHCGPRCNSSEIHILVAYNKENQLQVQLCERYSLYVGRVWESKIGSDLFREVTHWQGNIMFCLCRYYTLSILYSFVVVILWFVAPFVHVCCIMKCMWHVMKYPRHYWQISLPPAESVGQVQCIWFLLDVTVSSKICNSPYVLDV